ncbi:MAG: FxsA family protein [Gammaproteobacteria bacterium]|nr:MAG: FxsA family protein [Gammaproteobacteria bacterium]
MNAFALLLVLFLLVPLVEVYLLIRVGQWIGALPTIGLVVFTAVLGAALLRIQGLETLQRFQATLAQGRIPAAELLEGVVLAVSGALLLTPGFLTDTLGFLGLVPGVRRALVRFFLSRFLPPGGPGAGPRGPVTLEGEYRRLDDN